MSFQGRDRALRSFLVVLQYAFFPSHFSLWICAGTRFVVSFSWGSNRPDFFFTSDWFVKVPTTLLNTYICSGALRRTQNLLVLSGCELSRNIRRSIANGMRANSCLEPCKFIMSRIVYISAVFAFSLYSSSDRASAL